MGKRLDFGGFHWFVGLGLRLIYALFRLNPHVVHNKIANIAFFFALALFRPLCFIFGMNNQENALAAMILEEIKSCVRSQPEKAQQLSESYKTLCAAYEIRIRTEKEEHGGAGRG